MLRLMLSLALILIISGQLEAQSINNDSIHKRVEVELINGQEHSGWLLSQDGQSMEIKTDAGDTLSILFRDLATYRFISGNALNRRFAQTRYFYAPNAFNLKKGEGYYQNTWVLFNQVSVGFTDYFTLGVGMVPLFLFDPSVFGPVWITPKFSYPIVEDQLNVSAGGLFGSLLGENFNFGIVYGSVTYGNIDNNFTISGGYGRADGDWADNPTLSFSGIAKAGDHFYLITENYYINGTVIFSFGGRSDLRSVTLDYGLIGSNEFEGLMIPWLGVTVPFDTKSKAKK